MKKTLAAIFASFVLLTPVAFAENLVPCNGPECQACHLVKLADNILKWLVGILSVVGAVMLAVAGLKMVTAGGNPGAVSAAKETLTNIVVGFIIMLSAWLVIDTLMRVFVYDENGESNKVGPWNEIKCVDPLGGVAGPAPAPVNPPPAGDPGPQPPVVAECTDDAALIAKYKGSPVGAKAPGLQDMINCYLADPAVAAAVDNGKIYTTDLSHPRCSLTNGNRVCGMCSHSINSCHYGRGSGLGAKAVDFNARSGFTENQLFTRIQARRAACGGVLNFETDHTHISMSGC